MEQNYIRQGKKPRMLSGHLGPTLKSKGYFLTKGKFGSQSFGIKLKHIRNPYFTLHRLFANFRGL